MNNYFEVNGQRILWPNGITNLHEAKRSLSQQYPMLRHTHVYEEDVQVKDEGSALVYPVHLPPAKTKG